MAKRSVFVIGMGNMGSQVASALLTAGQRVTVWNRDRQKCAPLAERGATVAEDIAAGVAASDVVIGCVANYAVAGELLGSEAVSQALSGKLLMQFTTGTPQEAANMLAWAEGIGARYLEGTILSYPQEVAAAEACLLYSGPRAYFDEVEGLLTAFGVPLYVNADIGSSAALDGALLGSFVIGTLISFMHGAAICDVMGISLDTYLDFSIRHVHPGFNERRMREIITMIKSRDYSGNQSKVETWSAGIDMLAAFSRMVNIDTILPDVFRQLLARTSAAGHDKDQLGAMYEILRNPALAEKQA